MKTVRVCRYSQCVIENLQEILSLINIDVILHFIPSGQWIWGFRLILRSNKNLGFLANFLLMALRLIFFVCCEFAQVDYLSNPAGVRVFKPPKSVTLASSKLPRRASSVQAALGKYRRASAASTQIGRWHDDYDAWKTRLIKNIKVSSLSSWSVVRV